MRRLPGKAKQFGPSFRLDSIQNPQYVRAMHRPSALVSILTSVSLIAACRHVLAEGPETAPSGPPVLSESTMREAFAGPVRYETHIKPLFQQNCLPCHDGMEQSALSEVEAAIGRIRHGTYGICEETGLPIPAERLRAVPWTRFIRPAQERHDRAPFVPKKPGSPVIQ